MTKMTAVPFLTLLVTFSLALAPATPRSEVWSIDQSDSAGKNSPVVPTAEMLQQAGHCGHFSLDPTPDLLVLSPEGTHMFLSFRGPNPLSGDPHVSTGATPGVGVLKITEGGRNGMFEAIAPMSNIDSGGVQRADAHALWVRNVK